MTDLSSSATIIYASSKHLRHFSSSFGVSGKPFAYWYVGSELYVSWLLRMYYLVILYLRSNAYHPLVNNTLVLPLVILLTSDILLLRKGENLLDPASLSADPHKISVYIEWSNELLSAHTVFSSICVTAMLFLGASPRLLSDHTTNDDNILLAFMD